jgi:hypothetical protein
VQYHFKAQNKGRRLLLTFWQTFPPHAKFHAGHFLFAAQTIYAHVGYTKNIKQSLRAKPFQMRRFEMHTRTVNISGSARNAFENIKCACSFAHCIMMGKSYN